MSNDELRLDDYAPLAPPGAIRLVRHIAADLAGLSFLHVNSTKEGGGVAEILRRMIPLLRDLKIDARWEVITGPPAFYDVTKRIHNGLQGANEPLSPAMRDLFLETNRQATRSFSTDADLALIHDPQPVALIETKRKDSRWIWRCHIDLSRPQRATWGFLEPFVRKYDGAIFHSPSFARRLGIPAYIIQPSIDPLADKNREMSAEEVAQRVSALGVPLDRPMLLQVSRYDHFKDPVGVIQAFRHVRSVRDCILVLAGGSADDDPEGAVVLSRVREEANNDPDIFILALPNDAHLEINALQRAATVVIQKSLKEGFGLTVAEAMWKGKPVVAGAAGGIPLQIIHGQTGHLVHSIEGCAYAVRVLLNDAEERSRIGTLAREHVRRHFLITRHLADYLQILRLHAGRKRKETR